jgi:site-specific DNA-methyltransferase (adenine-specific)
MKKEYNGRASINLYNCDNMEFMKKLPDNYYDLAIVDPPYGIGTGSMAYLKSKRPVKQRGTNNKLFTPKTIYENHDWDNEIPTEEYFEELKRISKNQIIWGANYFGLIGGMLVWNKLNGETSFSDGEIAYCSFNSKTDIVYYMWSGMIQGENCSKNLHKAFTQIGNKALNQKRIHPTEKPIKLYEWILQTYAKKGDKIFDSHLGSASIALACWNYGFDLDGCELNEKYFNTAVERFENYIKQQKLF